MNPRSRLVSAFCLLSSLPILLLAARLLGWVTAPTAEQTFAGIGITAVGGLITGIISERFLKRGRNGIEQTAGLVATVTLSIITIGALYLLNIRGPMSSIGTPDRAIRQLFSFVEFLSAQGAGIMLSSASLSVV